jgi:hypothetical protein
VHVLQRLRELECAWDSAQLCTLAASRGLLEVLQWLKQQGAAFTEQTLLCAATQGQTAAYAYLLAQQCPCDPDICTAAARGCHLDTLQCLLEHGCPYTARALWAVAADMGHISVMTYLQQHGILFPVASLGQLLFIAGTSNQLAAAQWLRAQGAEWPDVLSLEVEGELKQWEGAVLEWARAAGCTAPLQF